jgi:proteasome alpha subunit
MGGQAERLGGLLSERWRPGLTLAEALAVAVEVLGAAGEDGAEDRAIAPSQLEVAVLDRTRPRRAFRRLTGALLADLLGAPSADDETT